MFPKVADGVTRFSVGEREQVTIAIDRSRRSRSPDVGDREVTDVADFGIGPLRKRRDMLFSLDAGFAEGVCVVRASEVNKGLTSDTDEDESKAALSESKEGSEKEA